jgi:hypothetical protein
VFEFETVVIVIVSRFCGVGSNSAGMVEHKRVQKHSNIVLLACLMRSIKAMCMF